MAAAAPPTTRAARLSGPRTNPPLLAQHIPGATSVLKQTALAAIAASLFGTVLMAEPLYRFDVAEDHTRFVFAPTPVHDDGLPAYGNPFVTQGYIYEAGTLDGGHEGVNPDGTAVFPDRVIGTWTCDGWYVGDGARTTSGTIIISRQVFQFDDGDVIISQGAELADYGVQMSRVVTGGLGDYAGLNAVLLQTNLGMSDGFGIRAQFEIETSQDHADLGSNREPRFFRD
jgi:hypothetical protein